MTRSVHVSDSRAPKGFQLWADSMIAGFQAAQQSEQDIRRSWLRLVRALSRLSSPKTSRGSGARAQNLAHAPRSWRT